MGFLSKNARVGCYFLLQGIFLTRDWNRVSCLSRGFFATEPPGDPKWLFLVQSPSRVWLFATPWTAAHQASLSITNSRSLLKLMSIKSVMPSNHLILCHPLLLLPSIFPSIRVFSNESVLHIRWPKYWSFSFSICPSNEYPNEYFPLGNHNFVSYVCYHLCFQIIPYPRGSNLDQ